jgi:hypothetical protein
MDLLFLCLPSLELLESDSDESESVSEEKESDSVSELYESDKEYLLFLFFLLSFRDFLCLPFTFSSEDSELSAEDGAFNNFFFFPERKTMSYRIHYNQKPSMLFNNAQIGS